MVNYSCLGLLLLALNGLAHDYHAATCAGHGAAYGNQVALGSTKATLRFCTVACASPM